MAEESPKPLPETEPGHIRLAPGVSVPEGEISMKAIRSSGPGGQNVNKRSTKIELRLHIDALNLPPDARKRLLRLAGSRLTQEGELIITSESERSQKRNREEALSRLQELVAQAMVRPKPRKPTKPSRGSKERRLQDKRERSEKKSARRPPNQG